MTEDDLFAMQREYKLANNPARLLYMLVEHERVTAKQIEEDYGIATDAAVIIHRLRKALAPHGIEIQSFRKTGYWMTDEHRRLVRDRLPATV